MSGRLGRQPGSEDQIVIRRRPVDEHPGPLADPVAVAPANQPLLEPHHAIAPPFLHSRRHVVREVIGRCAFFVRVGEDAHVVERMVVHERAQLVDVSVGFAGEARR